MDANRSRSAQPDPKPFNPYHKWLGIRDGQTPPNHYRLLGLELWETDEEVIRDAYSRQMNHVRHFWTGPHRDLCQQILDELLAARDTLLDPQLRRPYDRWLKIALNETAFDGPPNGAFGQPFTVHNAVQPAAIGSAQAEVQCAKCGVDNASSRKFCAGCGVALWEPCIECAVTCGPGDLHCGACGVSLAAAIQRRTEEFQARLEQAVEFHSQRACDKAIEILEEALLRDHPRLAAHRRRAEQMIAQVRTELSRLEQLAKTAFADADRLRQQGDFERAAITLDQLPAHLLTEPMQKLLETIRDQQVESMTLLSEIQQALSEKKVDGLLAKVERLLQLQPNHAEAQKLCERLQALEAKKIGARRKKLCDLAMLEVQRHNYANATNLLEQISAEHRTPEIAKFYEKVALRAAELKWLRTDLLEAVIYDEHLLPIAERLLKLQPEDARVKKFIETLRQQASLTQLEHLKGNFAWPRLPAKSHWGFPIDIFRGFHRIGVEQTQSAVLNDPGNYCVAAGLALQGLDQAALKTNLAPREKRSILDRLKSKKRSYTAAWGIDLGRRALKAVQLAYQPGTQQVMIVNSLVIPIQTNPGQTAADSTESIQIALKSFSEQVKLEGCAVCIGFPAQKTVMRLFDLPPIDAKKIPEIMQYEVKQQIPLPLETVAWDYQILDSPAEEAETNSLNVHPVALFGAKLEDVQAQLKSLTECGITVDVVQTDCVALYNLAVYECFQPGLNLKDGLDGRTKVLAFLDLGRASSNLVVTDGHTMFMRSIPLGGNDFTRALSKEYGLDWQQSEKLKRSPTAAPMIHQLYQALEPHMQKLISEVQQSIDQYMTQDKRRIMQKLLVVGGGWKLHGLLKYLCLGN